MSFQLSDLADLARFLRGRPLCTMRELAEGEWTADHTIVRHDIDDQLHQSLAFARWEAERGIRSSYFVLPTAPYWTATADVHDTMLEIQRLGHEVGLHCDAYHRTQTVSTALALLAAERELLRSWGLDVVGCADHGSGAPLNVQLWAHARPADAGFLYEAYILQRAVGATYVSDNGGFWRSPLERVADRPTVVLVHPQHWRLP